MLWARNRAFEPLQIPLPLHITALLTIAFLGRLSLSGLAKQNSPEWAVAARDPSRFPLREHSIDLAGWRSYWPSADSVTHWFFECVDCPRQFDSLSLALNNHGDPRIAYGKDHLYFAGRNGGQWHFETVDPSPGTGSGASLSLAQNGYAHISYFDAINGDLKYAFQNDQGWQIAAVDRQTGIVSQSSLALDSTGKAHISYLDSHYRDLKYAYQDILGWHIQVVDALGDVGSSTSLALDPADNPHISYFDNLTHSLKYAYQDDKGWHIETVDNAGGSSTSLALDQAGWPHISYIVLLGCYPDYTCSSELRYAHRDASGWHFQVVASFGLGSSTSLVLDPNGYPHISYAYYIYPCFIYCSYGTSGIGYRYLDSHGWHGQGQQSVLNFTIATGYTSLQLDQAGDPHIGYLVGNEYQLTYTYSKGGVSQSVEKVDLSRSVGSSSSRLDSKGNPHVAYYESTHNRLYYAKREAAGWQIDNVTAGGYLLSLALDSTDSPHIVYLVETPPERSDPDGSCWIEHTYQDTHGWRSEQVAYHPGNSCFGPLSLSADQAAKLHLVYFDSVTDSLNYASRDHTGWQTKMIASVSTSPINAVSLAVDSLGFPHIGYVVDGDVNYAFLDAQGWQATTLPIGEAEDISLSLDSQNNPHLGYALGTDCSLNYAFQGPAGWQSEFVGQGGCSPLSFALDTRDQAYLAYGRQGDQALMYAHRDASGWHSKVINSQTKPGESSLFFDTNGFPGLIFSDTLTEDLIYARLIELSHIVHLPWVTKD